MRAFPAASHTSPGIEPKAHLAEDGGTNRLSTRAALSALLPAILGYSSTAPAALAGPRTPLLFIAATFVSLKRSGRSPHPWLSICL